MAAMYGRIGAYGGRTCWCCDFSKGKRSLRMAEDRQWTRDSLEDSTYEEPSYAPGYDHYPEGGNAWPENVEDIPGVKYIPAIGG